MVNKAVAGLGVLLLVASIGMLATISVVQEWAIATLPGAPGCEKPDPLGTLGVFQSTYNPACSVGSDYEDTYAGTFGKEVQKLKTEEFWPLFPSQYNFGDAFDKVANKTEFKDCKSFYAEGAPIYDAASRLGGAKVDAGLADSYKELDKLVTGIDLGVNAQVAKLWAGALTGNLAEGYGTIKVTLGTGIAGLNGIIAFADSTFNPLTTKLGDQLHANTTRLCATNESKAIQHDPLTGAPTYGQAIERMVVANVAAGASGGNATIAAQIAAASSLIKSTVGPVIAACGSLTYAECLVNTVAPVYANIYSVDVASTTAVLGYDFATPLGSPANFFNVSSAIAQQTALANGGDAGPIGDLAQLLGACLLGGHTTGANCVQLFSSVNQNLTESWGFCLLAVKGGVIAAPSSGECNVLHVFSALGDKPELLGDLAEYAIYIPGLIQVFNGCAGLGLTYDQCIGAIKNPAAPFVDVAQQSRIPDSFKTPFALCLSANIDISTVPPATLGAVLTQMNVSFVGCKTFEDFSVASTILATVAATTSNAELLEKYKSAAGFASVFTIPCMKNGISARAECEEKIVSISGGALAGAILGNFINGTDSASFIKACEDDEKDIAAIKLAQTLVPVGIGALVVALLVSFLAIAKNSLPISLVSGFLGVAGVACAVVGLLAVVQAPMFSLLTDGDGVEGEALYKGGLAKPMAMAGIAVGVVGALLVAIAGCLNKSDESETAVGGKVDTTY